MAQRDDPSRGGGAADGRARSRSTAVAWVVAIVALIALGVVAWIAWGPATSDDAPEPSPSDATHTPSVTVTETVEADPSPSPDQTVPGGAGTREDPYWIGIDFTFDGSLVDGTDSVFNVAVAAALSGTATETGVACWAVSGTMTPQSWPTQPDDPSRESVPEIGISEATFEGATASGVDAGDRCDRGDLSGSVDLGSPELESVPAEGFDFVVMFFAEYADAAPDPQVALDYVTVGALQRPDGSDSSLIYVKPTGQ